MVRRIKTRANQSLDRYLQEIGEVSLLIPEEEIELARKIKSGDQMALEKLTKANLRFVVSVAKVYQGQGLPLTDLINEGNLATPKFVFLRNLWFEKKVEVCGINIAVNQYFTLS